MRAFIPALAVVLAAFSSSAWGQDSKAVQPSVVFRGEVAGVERFAKEAMPVPGHEVTDAWSRPHRTFVIDNSMDFARAWMLAQPNAKLPEVDFTRSRVVFILSNASNIRITHGIRSTIDYTADRPTGSDQPYTIAVFPRAAVEGLAP